MVVQRRRQQFEPEQRESIGAERLQAQEPASPGAARRVERQVERESWAMVLGQQVHQEVAVGAADGAC